MIKKLYHFYRAVLKNWKISKTATFGYKRKMEIFNILNVLYFKSLFYNDSKEVFQHIFGFKVSANSYSILSFLFKEIFISKDYFFETSKSNPLIIDCGANIGMSVLYFKSLYPDCSIIAFEPNPEAFLLLKKNVERNNLKNVELYNLALSDNSGEINFFVGDKENILLASTNTERGGAKTFKIKSDQLSRYINTEVDLIKIDIEGSEIQVLNDLVMSGKIKNAQNYIIEYHHRINTEKSSLSSFIKPFEEADFEYNIKATFGKIGVFQDILLNCYKRDSL